MSGKHANLGAEAYVKFLNEVKARAAQFKSEIGMESIYTDVDRLVAMVEAQFEVVGWAQAMLGALNVGDVASGSKLHLKLREVMIAYRAASPLENPNE